MRYCYHECYMPKYHTNWFQSNISLFCRWFTWALTAFITSCYILLFNQNSPLLCIQHTPLRLILSIGAHSRSCLIVTKSILAITPTLNLSIAPQRIMLIPKGVFVCLLSNFFLLWRMRCQVTQLAWKGGRDDGRWIERQTLPLISSTSCQHDGRMLYVE